MPIIFVYLTVMLGAIFIWFMLLKRPIYEAILVSFLLLLCITNTWKQLPLYIHEGLSTSLIFSMISFVAMSQILTKTKVIDNCVQIILAIAGRIPGGAGYASVIASSFMGALSGSGPGNVMATGSITIPAMKKSGFPPELAANIESASSYLGNMIPPSANIVAALGAYMALYPDSGMTTGHFWIACWGVSLWFILSRIVQVFAFCKYYKVKAIPKEEIPGLKEALKKYWSGLFLPIIILVPFVLDFALSDNFLTVRLGAQGASYFSKSLLIFIGGVASVYGLVIAKNKKELSPKAIVKIFSNGTKGLCSTVATCIFGYMIGALFTDIRAADSLQGFFEGLRLNYVGLAFVIPLLTCFMTMIIPGSSVVVMFGTVFISLFASAGADPLLVAVMLPCVCGVMGGITPPLALGMYAGMSIAGSDFGKTFRNNLWWVAAQYILEVIVLLGLLPVIGI